MGWEANAKGKSNPRSQFCAVLTGTGISRRGNVVGTRSTRVSILPERRGTMWKSSLPVKNERASRCRAVLTKELPKPMPPAPQWTQSPT
jgi:hypothetical protein